MECAHDICNSRQKMEILIEREASRKADCEYPPDQKKRKKKGAVMANIISDETIEYVGILAKLELSEEEKEAAKSDMGRMLDYIDKLNELDTSGVSPMSHVFPVNNVFREDVVTNGDDRKNMLANAPSQRDGQYEVPMTTVEE